MKIVIDIETDLTPEQLAAVMEHFNTTTLDNVVGGLLADAVEEAGEDEFSVWAEDITLVKE